MFKTLKQRIEELPEPDRTSRRGLYTDWEWEHLWELHAFPHQLPPRDDAWDSWTIVGSPGTGTTTAGRFWAIDKLFNSERKTILAVFHHPEHLNDVARLCRDEILNIGLQDGVTFSSNGQFGTITNADTKSTLIFIPANKMITGRQYTPDYLWADEISDAQEVMMTFPNAKKFVFTRPAKLPNSTRLSRAGEPRCI